jgi:HSP20 family protein
MVKTAVPGVKPEDIDISIVGNSLTIKGETKAEEKVEKQDYILQERHYGSFERSMRLPDGVLADKTEASFKDGILTLTVPKAAEARPKTIKVQAKTS